MAVSLIVGIWQATGAIRTANREIGSSSGFLVAVILWLAALGVSVQATLRILDAVSATRPPATELTVIPSAPLRSGTQAGTVVLEGTITYALNNRLKAALTGDETISGIELDSDGGNVFAGRALARTILEHGLTTHVESRCLSACTLAFAAGHRRTLGPDGKLGFHGYGFDTDFRVQTVDIAEEEAKDRRFLVEVGIAPHFIASAFATPKDEIWIPDRNVLVEAGLLTSP